MDPKTTQLHESIVPGAVIPVRIRPTPLAQPTIDYFVADDVWILRHDYTFDGDGWRFTIPAGFELDLASVPRPLRWLINSFELGMIAPLVHDYLYRNGGVTPEKTFSRAEADVLFKEIMKRDRVPGWRWRAAYQAVRWFGGGAWGRGRGT